MSSGVEVFRKGDKVRLRRPWDGLLAGAEVYLQADPAPSGSVPIDEKKNAYKKPMHMTFINVEMLDPLDA